MQLINSFGKLIYIHRTGILQLILFVIVYVLNIHNEFYAIFSIKTLAIQAVIWLFYLAFLYVIISIILSNSVAISFLTLFVSLIYFYAFPIALYIKDLPILSALHSFRFLIPIWLIVSFLLFNFIRKRNWQLEKIGKYLTLLLLCFSVFEFVNLFNIYYKRQKLTFANDFQPSNPISENTSSGNFKKRDIFFIVYDSYTSASVLQKYFEYNNDDLTSFLKANNFVILNNARSNYYYTPFSIASTLNMGYLPLKEGKFKKNNQIIFSGLKNIFQNHLFDFLGKHGYKIINLSVFPISDQSSPLAMKYFGSTEKDLLQLRTLQNASILPLIERFNNHKTPYKKQSAAQNLLNDIHFIRDTLNKGLFMPADYPRFIFLHNTIPHSPYILKRDGALRIPEENDPSNQHAYLEQLIATNMYIKKTVTGIRKMNPEAIVILVGDHGFRFFPEAIDIKEAFGILHAVYFPQNEYPVSSDSMTSVNIFRVVLNTYFNQEIQLLPDSLVLPSEAIKKDL